MTEKYTVNDNILRIVSPVQKEIQFESKIVDTLLIDGMFIVLLGPPASIRNVYGVDQKGSIAWQIDNFLSDMGFANIYVLENELGAGNWSGMHYYLNPRTGEILRKQFLK